MAELETSRNGSGPGTGRNGSGARRSTVTAGSARSLLLTVLGELVYPNKRPVWTVSLLHVLTGTGLEEQTARQAIARCASSGWLVGEKRGREVRWELSSTVKRLIEDGTRRVYSLHADPEPWDRTWLVLHVTVPQSHRAVRKKLYSALSWAGFGNPTPGLWLSPHPERAAEARQVIRELELEGSTLAFAGSSLQVGLSDDQIVQRAWNFEEVSQTYEALLERYSDVQPEPGDPVLFTHIELVSQWQRLPFMDPQLPEELLPDWIGRRAAVMIQRRRSEWYDAAQARWQEVVKATSPA